MKYNLKNFTKWNGEWALVTGPTSGMGESFANFLAQSGVNLILASRNEEKLKSLAASLEEKYNIQSLVVVCDLSKKSGLTKLFSSTHKKQIVPSIIINNAGFGVHNNFTETPWSAIEGMLHLNNVAPIKILHHFLPFMKEQKKGFVLNVASVAGYNPLPQYSVYSATKSLILQFGKILHDELKDEGIVLTTLCPGATNTEFFEKAGHTITKVIKKVMMTSDDVAYEGLEALSQGKSIVIPGAVNKATVGLTQVLPNTVSQYLTREALNIAKA